MLDDFLVRAIIAGIGIALVTGPLGCFVVWRRLSFFGDTLAHSALLGVLLSISLNINVSLTIFVVSSLVALILLRLEKSTNLAGDSLLGLISHSSLAIGLVILGFLSFIRFDVLGVLFGDILSVNTNDLLFIWIGGGLILAVLFYIWKPLFASTVNYELAEAEGMNPERVNAIFTILLAALIAISIKMIGVLLITGLLIIPTAMARNLSNNPKQMEMTKDGKRVASRSMAGAQARSHTCAPSPSARPQQARLPGLVAAAAGGPLARAPRLDETIPRSERLRAGGGESLVNEAWSACSSIPCPSTIHARCWWSSRRAAPSATRVTALRSTA